MQHLQEMLVNFVQKPLTERASLLEAYLAEKFAGDLAKIHNLYDLDQFRKSLEQIFQAADRKMENAIVNLISNKASAIVAIPDQWSKIPKEMLWNIIQHLTPREFLLLGKVNRLFRELTQSDYFWQQYGKLYRFKATKNKKEFVKPFMIFFGKTNNEIDSFIHAIARGNEKTVAALLPCEVIQTYLKGRFIFLFAYVARNSSLAILRTLEKYLASHHDIVKDIFKLIALNFALQAGRKEICAYLRSSFSSLPITQDLDRELFKNPLHLAAASGDLESLNYYIRKGFLVNSFVGDYTPLHMAAMCGQRAAAEWLLKNGANINLETVGHETPLSLALKVEHDELAKFLVEQSAALSVQAKETVLQLAVIGGCSQTIRYLREKGHEISSLDDHGNSYLHHAALATRNSTNVVGQMIACGLAVNQQNNNGQTPLHLAASKGDANTMSTLLSNGADIHCCDSNGENAMHYAVRSGDSDTVQLLLEKNLSAEQPNGKGETPVRLAVQGGHTAAVQLLLGSKFQVQTSRQRRHAVCEKMLTVLKSKNDILKLYNTFVIAETQHDPVSLAVDIAEFKAALVNDKDFDVSNMRKMLVKRLLAAGQENLTEFKNSKKQLQAGDPEFDLEQTLQKSLDLAIQEMQEKNKNGELPERLAVAFYELTYEITDPNKQSHEKLQAIEAFKAKILPSWWQTFGKILACIYLVAVGISIGFLIGFGAIGGCVGLGILNLATISTLISNIILGAWAASTATGGVSAGVLSSLWLFKATPEEKMAKRLAKDANLLIDAVTPEPKLFIQPLSQ